MQASSQAQMYAPQQSVLPMLDNSLYKEKNCADRPSDENLVLYSQQSDKNVRTVGLARTHKQFFNKTMKVSEINKISSQEAADGVSESVVTMGEESVHGLRTAQKDKGKKRDLGDMLEYSGGKIDLGGGFVAHLSSANSNKFNEELQELNSALNNGCFIEKEKAGEVYNILNISKDDAESIINLLKDYVTLKLGNGKEIQMPKLNLAMLSDNLPEDIRMEISHKINQNTIQNLQISSAVSRITGAPALAQTGHELLRAELNALAVGGSQLNKQAPLENNGKQTQELYDMLNKSSGVQATSASILQQLQSQVNKSSFNNTTTHEEGHTAINQTQNNTKSTNEHKVASQMMLLDNSDGNNLLGNYQMQAQGNEIAPVDEAAHRGHHTGNELSEFADLINDLNATENENTNQDMSLHGIYQLPSDLGVKNQNQIFDNMNGYPGEPQRSEWKQSAYLKGGAAVATQAVNDGQLDESQLINMIRIDDFDQGFDKFEDYSDAQLDGSNNVIMHDQDLDLGQCGQSLSSRRSSSSRQVNELDQQCSHIEISNSMASGEKEEAQDIIKAQ